MGRLTLAHARSVRGLAVPWRSAAAIALAVAALLALLYLAARETPVFAVRAIEVTGGSEAVREAVRAAAQPIEGQSLAALDGGALVQELEALPSVRSVGYDRAFPSTLRIFVRPERPLAIVRVGRDRWIVSERGRVIGPAPAELPGTLPRFRLREHPDARPGSFLTDSVARALLGGLAVVPPRFPARIATVRLERGALTMSLRTAWGAPELRLGEPIDAEVKLAVAALVLRSLSAEERVSAAYVDVSVPERTVVGSNSQPLG
jgi:cell division septal protein FtsQ